MVGVIREDDVIGVIGVIIEDDVIGVIIEDDVIGVIREDVCLAVLFISWLRGTMLLTVSAKLLGRRASRLSSLSLARWK